ncbi:MAG: hypothetical protein ACPGKS_02570 [Coraliomargarita sp.]
MTAPATQSPARWQKMLKRPLVFILLCSLALHILLGLILGGVKVFSILTKDEAEIEAVPPPPEAIQPKQREYKLKTMRSQRATQITTQVPISVDQPSDLNLPDIDIPKPSTTNQSIKARGTAGGIGGGVGAGSGESGFSTLFGNTSPLVGALEGTFIDFKQDRYRESPPDEGWMEAGADFLRSFRLREFRKYFNAEQKLYATHFYMPLMSADEAPRAFGVENLVLPSQWIAVYQGQFRSNTGGKFRFVGTADDILIVGVDGDTVLSAGFTDSNPGKWKPDDAPTHSGPNVSEYLPALTYGDWFTLKPGEPRELTVVLGEIPGGEFGSYLFIEDASVDYEMAGDRPILPVFKLKEFSSAEAESIKADGYPKRMDGPVFGFY